MNRHLITRLTWASLTIVALCNPSTVNGQIRAVPKDDYYFAFRSYYAGDYSNAMRDFRSASRGGVKRPDLRWVDAVCYDTMMGECFYHMGDLAAALKSYNSALRVFLANKGWLERIKFDSQGPQAVSSPVPITWAPDANLPIRTSRPARYPRNVKSRQSSLSLQNVNQQTVIVPQQQDFQIGFIEVLRCTSLALARRYELLGPAAPYDTLSNQMESRLAVRTVQLNPWANQIFGVAHGMAQMSAGREDAALKTLNQALLVGNFDHPLTAIALLQIGKMALAKNETEIAYKSFLAATFPAAQYEQLDVLEEAFALANVTHRLQGSGQPFQQVERAAVWAKQKRYQRAYASLSISAAENSAWRGESKQAQKLLGAARRGLNRDLQRGDLGARYSYATALVEFQLRRMKQGTAALNNAQTYQKRGSKRLFQIAAVYRLAKQDELSPRVASNLFNKVLRAPTARDWRADPMETLSVLSSPHLEELDYWLNIVLKRDEIGNAVVLADRIRRKKFFATLPMHGRLLALRWLLEAPTVLQDDTQKSERQGLLQRYPNLEKLTAQAQKLKAQLVAMPPIPEGEQRAEWRDIAEQLDRVSAEQEEILKGIALSPEPTSVMFPPLRTLDRIQTGLQPGQAVLDFVQTGNQTHLIMITAEKNYEHWSINSGRKTRSAIASTLRAFGNFEKNKIVPATQLTGRDWKEPAQAFYQSIMPQKTKASWRGIDELIIVPDGDYWYLPFEALMIDTDQGSQPLISLMKIRYVPTAALAVNDPRRRPLSPRTTVVVGRLFSRELDTALTNTAKEIADASPNTIVTSKAIKVGSSVVAPTWDQLVVLDNIEGLNGEQFGWSPAQIDGKGPGSRLGDWMELPWGAPDHIVLPGFHTAAETAVRTKTNGDEMLLDTLALLASGSRTILISRWRTGGQTSLDLVREFVTQLADESAASSFQRSVQITRSAPIDPDGEPRIKNVTDENLPTGEHPFFWAAYQLIDLGQPNEKRPRP